VRSTPRIGLLAGSLVASVLAVSAVACGGSVEVVRDAAGAGEIAVHGSADSIHDTTHEFLRKRCGGAYTVLDETPTDEGHRSWRIAYRCEAASQPGGDSDAKVESAIVRF
jgi:hypothetical protein